MELIGGVIVGGALRRDVRLAPLTGETELTLAELAQADMTQPERITRFLAATLAEVGGAPADARALSVGDRQHLVRRVGAAMGADLIWLTSACGACGEGFDLPVRQSELPAKPAGEGYPEAEILLRGRPARLRTPTGADQEAVARLDEAAALEALIDRLLSGPGAVPAAALTAEEVAAIEAAVEAMAPEVALEAIAACPECGVENRVGVDPYLTLAAATGEIYEDVHLLARRYHWSEAEILRLPRMRRKRYLQLIDRERGMISAPAEAAW